MRSSFASRLPLALVFGLCVVADDVLAQEGQRSNQVDLHALLYMKNAMYNDLESFWHIGNDGIRRTFNGAGEVIDYARLNRDQLLTIIATSPFTPQEREHLTQPWNGADSSQVSVEQIYRPSKDLLPLRYADPKGFRREQEKRHQPLAKMPVPLESLKDVPKLCTHDECLSSSDCWESHCAYCYYVGSLPFGHCR